MMAFATVMALIYINMQMQIYALAYEGKTKEKQIQRLADDNGSLAYNIWSLKSANNLGDKLLSVDSPMHFASQSHVVELSAAIQEEPQLTRGSVTGQSRQVISNVMAFFSSQAEARPRE
jgi:hypothetical protein